MKLKDKSHNYCVCIDEKSHFKKSYSNNLNRNYCKLCIFIINQIKRVLYFMFASWHLSLTIFLNIDVNEFSFYVSLL